MREGVYLYGFIAIIVTTGLILACYAESSRLPGCTNVLVIILLFSLSILLVRLKKMSIAELFRRPLIVLKYLLLDTPYLLVFLSLHGISYSILSLAFPTVFAERLSVTLYYLIALFASFYLTVVLFKEEIDLAFQQYLGFSMYKWQKLLVFTVLIAISPIILLYLFFPQQISI